MGFCTKCGKEIVDGMPHNCFEEEAPAVGFCTKCGQEIYAGKPHICPADREAGGTPGGGRNADINDIFNDIRSGVGKIGGERRKYDESAFERGTKIVPDCIEANDGEIPIKQYKIAKLRSIITLARAEGRLQITNKRIIFRASGRSIMGRVSLHQEFKINELSGVEFRNRPEFNFFNIIINLLLVALVGGVGFIVSNFISARLGEFFGFLTNMFALIVAVGWFVLPRILRRQGIKDKFYGPRLAALSLAGGALLPYAGMDPMDLFMAEMYGGGGSRSRFPMFMLVVILLMALINLLLTAFVPNLVIKIKTKGAASGIEVVKEEPAALLSFLLGQSRDDGSGFLEILPWRDTDTAMRELGTIIDDIQTLGDAAIEKWKED